MAEGAEQAAAPLEVIARDFGIAGVAWLVAAGAVTVMLGVLLSLLLGLSAFTVLVYYALTNLWALRLPPEVRLYPVAGLVCCLRLAFWVEPSIRIAGLGLIAVGLAWHGVAQRVSGRPSTRH